METSRGYGGLSGEPPAKPERTYRSNLLRSQSFNSHSGPNNLYKPNQYRHDIQESPPPLRSPSMIYRWSQSSNYLDDEKLKIPDNGRNTLHHPRKQWPKSKSPTQEIRESIFKEMKKTDRFRENNPPPSGKSLQLNIIKPQHPKNSPLTKKTVFQDGNTIKTISKESFGNDDDYSETVTIESKSDDVLNPSETNTVKIFSKKKIPLKNGHAMETIESSETKTIVKSQGPRQNLDSNRILYNSSPNGVVIKVRKGDN